MALHTRKDRAAATFVSQQLCLIFINHFAAPRFLVGFFATDGDANLTFSPWFSELMIESTAIGFPSSTDAAQNWFHRSVAQARVISIARSQARVLSLTMTFVPSNLVREKPSNGSPYV
jgi:hypothetical protein